MSSTQRNILRETIFQISSEAQFRELAMAVFRYQARENPVYRSWLEALKISPEHIHRPEEIPFLPVELFKTQQVISGDMVPVLSFQSSGTTGAATSTHYVADPDLYRESFLRGFEHFYGNVNQQVIIGLLPAYLERPGSSLVYMCEGLIRASEQPESGFYLYNHDELLALLERLAIRQQSTWLIGVSFALLDLAEKEPPVWPGLTVVETGGMKGRRREMIREELHETIRKSWPVQRLHSEYGMTELLSQAYLTDRGRFQCPPWMQVLIRDTNDPLALLPDGRTGGVNVIDLANLDSCSFIATQDLGKKYPDGSFDILGRFDNSDIRGCNMLVG